jgi:hypothetical protein
MQNLTNLTQSSAGNITCAKNFTVTGNLTTTGTVTQVSTTEMQGNLTLTAGDNIILSSGYIKLHKHLTTDEYALQIRSEYTGTTGSHWGIDSETHLSGDMTTGAIRGVQGVARLTAANSITGGSMTALYGQIDIDGTANGSGVILSAIYGLIGASGIFTAVSHLSAAWLDSQLTSAVSSGQVELLYLTNNGSTVIDVAYIGNHAVGKLNYLFNLSHANTPYVATGGTVATASGTSPYLKIKVGDTTYGIPVIAVA